MDGYEAMFDLRLESLHANPCVGRQRERQDDMATTTISSGESRRAVGRSKRAAKLGPVLITDRGETTHVLLTIEEYRRIKGPNIVEMLWCPEAAEIEFEIPPRLIFEPKPVDWD